MLATADSKHDEDRLAPSLPHWSWISREHAADEVRIADGYRIESSVDYLTDPGSKIDMVTTNKPRPQPCSRPSSSGNSSESSYDSDSARLDRQNGDYCNCPKGCRVETEDRFCCECYVDTDGKVHCDCDCTMCNEDLVFEVFGVIEAELDTALAEELNRPEEHRQERNRELHKIKFAPVLQQLLHDLHYFENRHVVQHGHMTYTLTYTQTQPWRLCDCPHCFQCQNKVAAGPLQTKLHVRCNGCCNSAGGCCNTPAVEASNDSASHMSHANSPDDSKGSLRNLIIVEASSLNTMLLHQSQNGSLSVPVIKTKAWHQKAQRLCDSLDLEVERILQLAHPQEHSMADNPVWTIAVVDRGPQHNKLSRTWGSMHSLPQILHLQLHWCWQYFTLDFSDQNNFAELPYNEQSRIQSTLRFLEEDAYTDSDGGEEGNTPIKFNLDHFSKHYVEMDAAGESVAAACNPRPPVARSKISSAKWVNCQWPKKYVESQMHSRNDQVITRSGGLTHTAEEKAGDAVKFSLSHFSKHYIEMDTADEPADSSTNGNRPDESLKQLVFTDQQREIHLFKTINFMDLESYNTHFVTAD